MDMYCEPDFLSEDTYNLKCIKYESPFFLYWWLCFISTLIPKGTKAVEDWLPDFGRTLSFWC